MEIEKRGGSAPFPNRNQREYTYTNTLSKKKMIIKKRDTKKIVK